MATDRMAWDAGGAWMEAGEAQAVKELTPLLIQQIYSVNTLAPYKVAQVTGQRYQPLTKEHGQ